MENVYLTRLSTAVFHNLNRLPSDAVNIRKYFLKGKITNVTDSGGL